MGWNINLAIVFGFVLGAVCAATFIALHQTTGTTFDLDTLGKISTDLIVPLLTMLLVGFTAVLARETRQMWVQNRLPHVVVSIEPMHHQGWFMEFKFRGHNT